jgi:hypothetical protein
MAKMSIVPRAGRGETVGCCRGIRILLQYSEAIDPVPRNAVLAG